jgi:hypothetical protein
MHASRWFLPLLFACCVGCAAPRSSPDNPSTTASSADDQVTAGHVLTGDWGGLHVLLSLSPDGGRIEYDCGQGTLDGPIRPDASGAFRVAGHHMQGHGGPVRAEEEPPPPQPATYEGTVSGDVMQLRVTSNGEALGSYTLRRGADPQMVHCL